MKRHNLEKFELSQAYLFFWDKLEKANYFLESVLDTLKEPLDGRLVSTLMSSPVGDGGQWDMAANLVQKYGLVSFKLPWPGFTDRRVDMLLFRSRKLYILIRLMP